MANNLEKLTPSDILWEKKYAPKSFDDLLLPKTIKDKLSNGEIRNFLFTGQQGSGKTSTAYVISRGRTIKFIDCSSNRSIQMVRDEISSFCEIASIDSTGKKVIILDEIDALPAGSQQALRGTIEKFEPVARFIATCNYPEKLIGPVLSRFALENFDLPSVSDRNEQISNYATRIKSICSENGMTIDNEAIVEIIKKHYPDMRSILQILQDCYDSNIKILTKEAIKKGSTLAQQDDAYEKIIHETNPVELYKFFSSWRTKEQMLISSLQSSFTTYIWNRYKTEHGNKLGEIAIISNKYGLESKQSIDIFITMLAYVYELSKIVK